MKREKNLYISLISDENLERAILEVNQTHRWHPHHKPNRTVLWVESDIPQRIKELRKIINDGFTPAEAKMRCRWDKSAGKWRNVYEPQLWPDQYVHHALMQSLEPAMMRGMDNWCCGSIKNRGIHYGRKGIAKWMRNDVKGTRCCAELDIYHFYDSISPKVVVDRMRQLIKDYRVLDLIGRVVQDGVMIGVYCSQWFANVILQPLDQLIRSSENKCSHYLRYIDNFTIFSPDKNSLKRLVAEIECWLAGIGLKLKSNWQIFDADARLPNALGYRYGRGYILLRKRNLFRLKRQLGKLYAILDSGGKISRDLAAGLLSRLGQLRHCNSKAVYEKFVRPGTQKTLKCVVRKYTREERAKWNISLEPCVATA